jgi:hypothetical protein
MIASLVASLIAFQVVPSRFPAGDPRADTWILLITVAISTVTWITVTFLTRPEPDAVLDGFYRKVRPGGPGWVTVSTRLGYGREQIPGGALAWTNWIAGVVAVYSTLFGIGKLIFGNYGASAAFLVVAALAFAWIIRAFRGEGEGPGASMAPPAPAATRV